MNPIDILLHDVQKRANEPLSEQEIELTALLMRRVRFDPYCPQAIFLAWEGTFYNKAVELAVLRTGQTGDEILLTRRLSTDPFYPGQWHMPGSVVIPGNNTERTLVGLMERELGSRVGFPTFVHEFEFLRYERPRGQGFCNLYKVMVGYRASKSISHGTFFPINHLPEPMVEHHITMINKIKEHL